MNLPELAAHWQQISNQIESQLRQMPPDVTPLSADEQSAAPRQPLAVIDGLWRGPGDASCYLAFCIYGRYVPAYGEERERIETDDVTLYTKDGEVSVYDALPELFLEELEVEALRSQS